MLEGKIRDSDLERFLRQEYRQGKINGLPGDWTEDEVVSHICKEYRSTAVKWYKGDMEKGEQVVTHEEYKEMIDVFGRMTDAFKDLADHFEEENKDKARKKVKAGKAKAKKEYYSIFTKEETALLSSAGQAKATGDKPEVHEISLSDAFVRAIPEESDKEKEWRARKENAQRRMIRREYGDEKVNLLKRNRDLTLSSGTRSTEDRNRAEVGSDLRGNVTMQNIGIQRESMGRLRRAVNREQEIKDIAREKQAIRTNARVLAGKLINKPWTQLSSDELEEAKELFGDKLPEIIRANEKKFGPF
jgi:hypothetical protein